MVYYSFCPDSYISAGAAGDMVMPSSGLSWHNTVIDTVGRYMLKAKRQFIIIEKAVFMNAIIRYAEALPDPIDDKGNGLPDSGDNLKLVTKQNSAVYMGLFRKFIDYCGWKRPLMVAGAKIVIDELEHDPAYDDAFMFLAEEFIEAFLDGRIKPRDQNQPPESMWKEPKPYGNLIGRKFKQYIKTGENE